jgi:hypothetical protein
VEPTKTDALSFFMTTGKAVGLSHLNEDGSHDLEWFSECVMNSTSTCDRHGLCYKSCTWCPGCPGCPSLSTSQELHALPAKTTDEEAAPNLSATRY